MNKPKVAFLHHETCIEVPFHDVDALRIVWHGHYYKYFEVARCALLRNIDYDYQQMVDSHYSWPVIETFCRYRAPLRYGDQMIVHSAIVEYVHRLKIDYTIYDMGGKKRLANGHTVQVAISMPTQELCLTTPEFFRQKIESLGPQKP